MPILDLIEFFDNSGEIMVTKVPQEGSGEFRMGSQLVVQESQVAVFFRDGRALDGFKAGRFTLLTQNLPMLANLLGAAFGGKSPFRAYVYFIATKTFTNLGWGTPTPVLFRDTEFRMVTLRAHGMYSVRVVKPRTFLQAMVGTRGMETTYAIEAFFKSIIVSRFNETIGKTLKSILDLPVQYNDVALGVKAAVKAEFEQYGLELADLIVEAITLPPDVQEMINRATSVAAQDAGKYQAIASADALRDAARNPGSAGAGMGTGLGLGLGFGVAKQFADSMGVGAAQQMPVVPPPTGALTPAPTKPEEIRFKLQELKQWKEDGLINESDFEEQKRILLSRF